MQKSLAIAVLLLVITAFPVMASPNQNALDHQPEKISPTQHTDHTVAKIDAARSIEANVSPTTTVTPTLTVTPSISISPQPTCDKDGVWKNHGQYVSCVAHHDHENIVAAAHSDVGKKQHPSTTPTGTPSVSPSISPSTSPTGTPSATPSPITSAGTILGINPKLFTDNLFVNEFRQFFDTLSHFVSHLTHSHKQS